VRGFIGSERQAGDSGTAAMLYMSMQPSAKEAPTKRFRSESRPPIVVPGTRFSLAPDGKSFVYTTERRKYGLWMLQGYEEPGWLARLSGSLK
jgi:hypothetical protein